VHYRYTHRGSALPEGPLGGLLSLSPTIIFAPWIGEGRQPSLQPSNASNAWLGNRKCI